MRTPSRSLPVAALVCAALTLYAQVAAAPLAPRTFPGAAASQYVPGEVLVKFKPTAGTQGRMASAAARGHAVLANLDLPGWAQVRVGVGQTVETALSSYRDDPGVETVQPNYIYRAAAAPNDSQYGQLWAFKNVGQTVTTGTAPNAGTSGNDMNIEPAWGHITDCSSVVVAVLDSGVDYTHEDLAANMWNGGSSFSNHGHDFVDNDGDPMDPNGHGTHVAGIIGAVGNNGTGTTGVCQKASVMAVRVLGTTGNGTTATVIQGIHFAVTHGAKVINMSFVGGGSFDPLFSDAIANAQDSDVVVVVVAGNDTNDVDGASGTRYPCNFIQPNLVCVAALDQNYALARFSSWGATSVDVGAPGTNILSTWAGAQSSNSSYNTIDGTSMASPQVAGLASMLRAFNPQYTFIDTVNAIKSGGRPVPALAGKTESGKAADVMSSLAYINPPTGVTATVR
jgi:subtilisin family serine protease